MATKEELLERFKTDPEMRAEARRIEAAGRLSMRDALRLYRKYQQGTFSGEYSLKLSVVHS